MMAFPLKRYGLALRGNRSEQLSRKIRSVPFVLVLALFCAGLARLEQLCHLCDGFYDFRVKG